jgi:hypothetical protein
MPGNPAPDADGLIRTVTGSTLAEQFDNLGSQAGLDDGDILARLSPRNAIRAAPSDASADLAAESPDGGDRWR